MNQPLSTAGRKNHARVKPRSTSAASASRDSSARIARLKAEVQRAREDFAATLAQLQAEQLQQTDTQRDLEVTVHRYADLFDFGPVPYLVLDHFGFIRDSNVTASSLLGPSREKMRNTLLDRFTAKPDRRKLLNHLSRCRRSRHPQQTVTELNLLASDGESLVVQLVSVPEAVGNGDPGRKPLYRTALIDITERKRMEGELRQSEERFRLIVNHAPVAMIMVDVGGRIVMANPPAEKLFGRTSRELLGLVCTELMPGWFREVRTRSEAAFTGRPNAPSAESDPELHVVHKDGVEVPVELGLNPVQLAEGQFIMATIIDVSERKRAQHIMRRTNEILEERVRKRTAELRYVNADLCHEIAERKNLQHRILEVSEREQRRVGQDLHDSLGQQLTGVAMLADALREKLRQKKLPETAEARRLTVLLEQARRQSHRLAYGLQPVAPDPEGLVHSLRQLAKTVTSLGVGCRFQCSPPSILLSDNAKATHLYRIAQEAVSNAMHHGRCRHIELLLAAQDGSLRLEIRNDGRKFAPPAKKKPHSLGLQIMKFRSEAMGGTLAVRPLAPIGTVVVCETPVGSFGSRKR